MSEENTLLEQAVGKQIKALRALKGWSQADLAERAGIHARRISQLENGKSQHVENIKQVAAALGLTVSELFAQAEQLLRTEGAA